VQAIDAANNTVADSYTWSVQGALVNPSPPSVTGAAPSSPPSVTGAAPSSPTPIVSAPPQSTAAPRISGATRPGDRLTGINGSWSGNPAPGFSDHWQRCDSHGSRCRTIAGQTNARYTIVSGDAGSTLRFSVTATNDQGSSTAASDPTAVVRRAKAVRLAPVRRASLVGLANGVPRLRVTLTGGTGDAPLKRVTIAVPNGLSFSGSKRSLRGAIVVTGTHGARLSLTPKIVRGSLVLPLQRATVSLRVQIKAAALRVSEQLAHRVELNRARRLQLTLTIAGQGAPTVHTRLNLEVG
jgi:hypothetical protein